MLILVHLYPLIKQMFLQVKEIIRICMVRECFALQSLFNKPILVFLLVSIHFKIFP